MLLRILEFGFFINYSNVNCTQTHEEDIEQSQEDYLYQIDFKLEEYEIVLDLDSKKTECYKYFDQRNFKYGRIKDDIAAVYFCQRLSHKLEEFQTICKSCFDEFNIFVRTTKAVLHTQNNNENEINHKIHLSENFE